MKKTTRDRLVLPILLPVGIFVGILALMVLFSRILLGVSAEAATAVALLVAIVVLGAAGVIATRKRLAASASLGSLLGVVAGIAMLAGGVALAVAPHGEEGEEGGGGAAFEAELTAPKGAAAEGFEVDTLAFPAGTPVALTFENQDPGVQHNVAIFDGDPEKDPAAPTLFEGALVTGPITTTYEIDPLPEGTFPFHCTLHPATMKGTLEVSPGGGEAGGGGGPAPNAPAEGGTGPPAADGEPPEVGGPAPGAGVTLVASGLAFDLTEISLAADSETPLVFDNQDAGVPHNLAIYDDPSLPVDPSTPNLFTFEPFPGLEQRQLTIPAIPAGTYSFQCDVHPTMAGTVNVT